MSVEIYVTGHHEFSKACAEIQKHVEAGGAKVTISSIDARTAKQNRMLHATIGDIARQVTWYGKKLKVAEWKIIFTAAVEKQEAIPGIDGGFVVLGKQTSSMSKAMFSSVITVALAFGEEKGVQWGCENWKSIVETYLKENGYTKEL